MKNIQIHKKIDAFKKTLHIPQGLSSENSLYESLCYAIRFEKRNKVTPCKNEQEFIDDISEEIFPSLHDVKDQIVLDLDCQNFEYQYHLLYKVLMRFNYFLRMFEQNKKFRQVTFEKKEGNKIDRHCLTCLFESFNCFQVVYLENENTMRKIF